MIKVDLITGFLGSGKTTFLKKYAKYLMKSGMRIGIIENDFGAVNIDMLMLQELSGENCELEMIAGGCDADCHYRRFKTKLIAMGMRGFDRVLIEPSGIYDVDEFFDVLREEPLDQWYEIGNVITIVDAKLPAVLSRESDYLLASQAANAGRIVLSHTGEASEQEIGRTLEHLNNALRAIHCGRSFQKEIICKDWETFTDEDFADIASCGYVPEDYVKLSFDTGKAFSTLYFMNAGLTGEEARTAADRLMRDTACGNIFRIKGFLQTEEGGWLELNATREQITLKPAEKGQEVLIVIGEGLVEQEIKKYLKR